MQILGLSAAKQFRVSEKLQPWNVMRGVACCTYGMGVGRISGCMMGEEGDEGLEGFCLSSSAMHGQQVSITAARLPIDEVDSE